MSAPVDRIPAAAAPMDLVVIQKWEEFCAWMLLHTSKWPKCTRFSLVSRLDAHCLEVMEQLVVARYDSKSRHHLLREANLALERMRFLCRIARQRNAMPSSGFETAMRGIDECGRMIHGWRVAIGDRAARAQAVDGADPLPQRAATAPTEALP
jgi:hypothetical protein